MIRNPILAIKEIGDLVIRKNFQSLVDYFDLNGQLDGFKHLEFEVTSNQTNLKINHGLGLVPKDVLVTRLICPSAAQLDLNFGQFSTDSIDITVSGLAAGETLKCRMFVGSYKGSQTNVTLNETDKQRVAH